MLPNYVNLHLGGDNLPLFIDDRRVACPSNNHGPFRRRARAFVAGSQEILL